MKKVKIMRNKVGIMTQSKLQDRGLEIMRKKVGKIRRFVKIIGCLVKV